MNGEFDEPMTAKEFMSAIGEHISELRKRLFIGLIALLAATVLCMFFSGKLMNILCLPIGGLDKLRSIEVTENVSAVFRVALLGGIIVSCPVLLYEILAFILPALKSNEKRTLFFFLPFTILFFLSGVAFAYFILLPVAIPFLTSFMGIVTEVRPANYISFVTNMLFWVGVVFEMPLVVFILARIGLITAGQLLKNWRQAVVVCAILAMIITPTIDPVNMLILMVPLILLFFLSVLFARIAERRHKV
ncbi:MAG: twin-arginine translocase subunit TatC [Flexilinea sp.]